MDTILQGMPSTICYLNNILVTGKNDGTFKKSGRGTKVIPENGFREVHATMCGIHMPQASQCIAVKVLSGVTPLLW